MPIFFKHNIRVQRNSISRTSISKNSNIFLKSYKNLSSKSDIKKTPKFENFFSFPEIMSKETHNIKIKKNFKSKRKIKNLMLKNGGIYEGNLLNNIPNGQGTIVYENGSFYNGDFLNGKKEGYGKFYEKTVFTYIGEFYNDFFHGVGRIEMTNGDFFQGHFIGGKKEGEGILKDKNGLILKIGKWKDGKFVN